MELRHLRYFLAVAEEGHVTRAAEKLGIQQPPLSQQIKALERELDVRLFRRKSRGIELTDAGRTFLGETRAILEAVAGAVVSTRRTARGEQGTVAVGFTSSTPFQPFMPRVIRLFREAHPLVAVLLEESGTSELVAGLRSETIDVAFVRSRIADPSGIATHRLLDEEMIAAIPKGHKLAGRGREAHSPIKLSALAREVFILYRRPHGPGLYDAIIAACRSAGFSPIVGQEAPRITSTLNLVAAGLGVTLVPRSLERLRMDGVVYRSITGAPGLVAPLSLAFRRNEAAPATRRFIDLVRRAAAEPRN